MYCPKYLESKTTWFYEYVVPNMITPSALSSHYFYKSNSFYNFLFAFLDNETLARWMYSKRKELSPWEQNFPFKSGPPLRSGAAIENDELPPLKLYSVYLNLLFQIWHCLAENAIYLTDREACFKWFAKVKF